MEDTKVVYLSEWFDPDNELHLVAWKALIDDAEWPTWFIVMMTKNRVVVDIPGDVGCFLSAMVAKRWFKFKVIGG